MIQSYTGTVSVYGFGSYGRMLHLRHHRYDREKRVHFQSTVFHRYTRRRRVEQCNGLNPKVVVVASIWVYHTIIAHRVNVRNKRAAMSRCCIILHSCCAEAELLKLANGEKAKLAIATRLVLYE